MRKAQLLSLLAIFFLLASRGVCGAFSESNVNGTYAFTLQATATDPARICNGGAGCGGVNNANGSIGLFYKRFAADLKSSKCPSAAASLRAAAPKIGAAGPRAGDTFYAAGNLIADGSGDFTDGTATFNSTSLGGEVINFFGTGTTAIVCGGQDKSGECSRVCTSNSLNCSGVGGYGVTGNGGTAVLYAYPQLHPGECAGFTTADECCSDPSLVIVIHLTFSLQNLNGGQVAQRIRAVITDQGAAGVIDATLQ